MTKATAYCHCIYCGSRRGAYYGNSDSDTPYYCHKCERRWSDAEHAGAPMIEKASLPLLDPARLFPWPNGFRRISADAAGDLGLMVYRETTDPGSPLVAEVAEYRNPVDGTVAFQKYRDKDRKRRIHGESEDFLFGGHRFKSRGKRIFITEGEVDAASVRTVLKDWPVVSLPHGAQSAARVLPKHLKYLEGYEEIVLAFDADEPGQVAAKQVAELLPPGRVRIVSDYFGYKDANDLLQDDEGHTKLPKALFRAADYSPIDLLEGDSLWSELITEVPPGAPWWCPGLNEATKGRRQHELSLVLGSTASGKTSFAFRQVVEDIRNKRRVGILALEEGPDDVARRVLGEYVGKPLYHRDEEYPIESLAEYRDVFDREIAPYLTVTEHKGGLRGQSLDKVCQALAASARVDFILVDHITLAAAGQGSNSAVEELMANLVSLKAQYPVHITALCQLKKGDKDYEKGAPVYQSDSFGSTSIMNAANVAVAVERDQTTGNPAKVRLVKRRRGSAALDVYDGCYVDPQSGQMFSCEIPQWKYEWDRNKRQGA